MATTGSEFCLVARARIEALTKAKIRLSSLYEYAPNFNLLHCPGDLRSKRQPAAVGRAFDSYSRGAGVNGEDSDRSITKETAIRAPTKQWVFVEDSDTRGFNMGCWMMDPDTPAAIDNLPVFHNNRGTLGYADGHAIIHKWLDDETLRNGRIATAGNQIVFGSGCMGPKDSRFMGAARALSPSPSAYPPLSPLYTPSIPLVNPMYCI